MSHRTWRQGLRITEVPIIFTERLEGTSKMSKKIVIEALVMVWSLLLQNGLMRSPKRA
jgi:dolichol-phosphate mannosyltransferase